MKTEESNKRAKFPAIKEIQPLAWQIETIPDELCQVYALRLPNHWRAAIQDLDDIDKTPPVRSLYTSLKALAPEIISFLPRVFSQDPERRPEYWLIAEFSNGKLGLERLMWAVQSWLIACYSSGEVRAISQRLKASDLKWELLNLQTATPDILAWTLPDLVARWLLRTGFEFRLSNGDGQAARWPVRLAPSNGPEADLITWPPVMITTQQAEHSYSYYLNFHIGSIPDAGCHYLLCQPGIRRWASRPIARTNGNGRKPYIDLAWGREKSVYLLRQSASWLTQQPAETTLIRLGLTHYHEVKWTGGLPKVLASLTPHEVIPDPIHLLASPTDFQPNILVVHDNLMGERHPVGLGIETADRWEVFDQLTHALPAGMNPAPLWHKRRSFLRAKPSFAARPHTQVEAEPRLNGAGRMQTPALIEICSSDADRWERALLDELGLRPDALDDETVEVAAADGSTSLFRIVKHALPPELSAELPPAAADGNQSQFAAERSRVRAIQNTIKGIPANAGILVEMPNYREIYARDSREARRDPKRAVRWGLARTGRVSQFIQPEQLSPDNYEERIRNGVRDLLRQMDFHLNPLYTGFKGTSLPKQIDLLAPWQIRLNPRRRGEQKVTMPLLIYAPADEYELRVCLPGDNGPTWYSYHKALLTAPEFAGGYEKAGAVRSFFARAIQDFATPRPTLILLDEQNLRSVWPELKDASLPPGHLSLSGAIPMENTDIRVARLRYSSDGSVPLVCPTHTFGRFSGVYSSQVFPRIFYSIQQRPVSARRPTGLRQRDAWRRLSWNPSTLEIVMLNLQPDDVPEEWAWVVHRLREESSHTDVATLLPEPLHAASKISEYVLRIAEDDL
jgi:hypothetical protein